MDMATIKLGTCSWNYDSWVPLVYSQPRKRAADYLGEYAGHFDTAEIDSWFYKIPSPQEARDYLAQVPATFTFTCKVFEEISLTHRRARGRPGPASLEANPSFLSVELFKRYADSIEEFLPRTEGLILEFEYLNKDKMPSLTAFLDRLDTFVSGLGKAYPLAIETRNKAYLTAEYFRFLDERALIPVFSEKLYMPSIHEVYDEHRALVRHGAILRLLGGDRKEIEARTGEAWNQIVDPKPDKERIADMSIDLKYQGNKVIISVNNHYEGSAPMTIEVLRRLLEDRDRGGAQPIQGGPA